MESELTHNILVVVAVSLVLILAGLAFFAVIIKPPDKDKEQ